MKEGRGGAGVWRSDQFGVSNWNDGRRMGKKSGG